MLKNISRLNSIQNQYMIEPFHASQKLSSDLEEALQKLDIEGMKDLLRKGAYSEKVFCFDKGSLLLVKHLQDDVLFNRIFLDKLAEPIMDYLEQAREQFETSGQEIYLDRLLVSLKSGDSFSREFFVNLFLVVNEIGQKIFSKEELDSWKDFMEEELTVASFAASTRDLEFIKLIVESGHKFDLDDLDFLDPFLMTPKGIEIMEYLLTQDYKIEDFLGETESFEELFESEEYLENPEYVEFLNKHGIFKHQDLEPHAIHC